WNLCHYYPSKQRQSTRTADGVNQRQTSSNEEPSNFKCKQCGRVYMRRYSLNRHIRVECFKLPKYQCNICQGWFKYKHNMTAHMMLHTDQPKFACNICSERVLGGCLQLEKLEHK
ncbi:early growth response protein 1-like, partial [Copidosoma floridanum]|uniref:early growth response protein 1-like n=1 Tax=Copidosoma floridanum TaxID=29053 RepID=UPI0006C97EBD